MELFWPGRGHVVNSGFDASLVGMRDRRRMQFLGKRRTPGALKWRSSKTLDSQEQTHTHKKYAQRIKESQSSCDFGCLGMGFQREGPEM